MIVAALLSGSLVGFVLGLIGGGGSILATPLLLYAVALSPHRAIGTGALAVSANAFVCLGFHARARHVRWTEAVLFAAVGTAGAATGSLIGKQVDGRHLLLFFALLMVVVGIKMLRQDRATDDAQSAQPPATLGLLVAAALGVGALSGFFGVGGGFLIVPGLMFSTAMPMIDAVGSSLLAVGAFGLTTAVNYARSGLVDWPVAGEFIAGGLAGALFGMQLASRLASMRGVLNTVFATFVFAVALFMFWKNVVAT